MSLVDDVISDAVRKGVAIEGNRLAKLLTPLAARNGFPRHNGEAFAHDVIKRNSDYREEIAKAIKPVRALYANDETIQVMSAGLVGVTIQNFLKNR